MHLFEKSKENRYINVAIEFCKNFLRYIFSIKSLAVYTICFILWGALAFSGGLMSGTGAQTVVAVIGCAILALPVWLIMCTFLHLYHVVKKFCNRAREKEKARSPTGAFPRTGPRPDRNGHGKPNKIGKSSSCLNDLDCSSPRSISISQLSTLLRLHP